MTLFRFTLEIEGADLMTDAAQNALFEAGCDDATFASSNGVQTAAFDRDATEFAEAVASTIKAVEAAVRARVLEMRTRRRSSWLTRASGRTQPSRCARRDQP